MVWPITRTDVELLAAAPADADAFAEFYRRHERAVLGFFVHWCRSGELAADLMAETFAAAFEARSRDRAEVGEPRAWLFGIARHVLLRASGMAGSRTRPGAGSGSRAS
jgi:DNA-directed RNA polymerase specialized sigma24 family protein